MLQEDGSTWVTARFSTLPGALYTLQSSADLQSDSWINVQNFYALGDELNLALFERQAAPTAPNGSSLGPPVEAEEPLTVVSFFLRPSADGNSTHVSFRSPYDGVLLTKTLPTSLVAEWDLVPFFADVYDEHFIFLSAFDNPPANFVETPVDGFLPDDLSALAALSDNFGAIQQEIQANHQDLQNRPVPPPPHPDSRRFYRLERSLPDSDDDGIPDWTELHYPQLDPFNSDSTGNGESDLLDSTLDLDGDGISNADEDLFGSNPFNSDSDGDGIPDSEDVSPVLVSIQRKLDYHFEDYEPEHNPTKELTTDATWPNAMSTTENPTVHKLYNTLHTKLTDEQPFPESFPDGVTDVHAEAEGNANTFPPLPGVCYHATLEHRQVMARAASSTDQARTIPALKITKRTFYEGPESVVVELLDPPLVIPADKTKSNITELTPAFLGTGSESHFYGETVEVSLLPLEIRVRQDVGYVGPFGKVGMYMTPQPNDGNPVGELFSLWEGEQAYVTIGGALGDLIDAGELPENTIQWSSPSLPTLTDIKEYPISWAVASLKVVTLSIAGEEIKIRINIPNTGTLRKEDQALKDQFAPGHYTLIQALGLKALNNVQLVTGESPGNGGTRQDALRHSTWNLLAAAACGANETLLFTTAQEHSGKLDGKAFASNTTMDIHNNGVGAIQGAILFEVGGTQVDTLDAIALGHADKT